MTERRLKQPAEAIAWSPFAAIAPIVITGCTAVARGLIGGAVVLDLPAGPVAGERILIGGGSDGEIYLVTARGELASGEIIERDLELAVIDTAWTMPDGGAPYLSIAEFVKRFGLPEVILMTDGDGSGRIDRDYLIGALVAAQSQADLNLGSRYAIPLTIVPEAVKTAICDIARGRLYPRGAPEGVALQVKSAERTLERIASGALVLPLATGEVAAPAPSATPILISTRGRRAYPNGLDDLL